MSVGSFSIYFITSSVSPTVSYIISGSGFLGIDEIDHTSYINLLNLFNTNLKDLYKNIYPNKQFKEQKKNKGRP